MTFNHRAVAAIYKFEMHRFMRTLMTGLIVPAITTSLYFVVFGSAIGSRMTQVDGIPYAAFIVPGLIMLSMFTESINNASFGIYMPKWVGTIYELNSAPVSPLETILGYIGAAATKSLSIGLVIFATAHLFVALPIAHPFAMVGFLVLIAVSFCLFGFILGLWAQSWEQLSIIPMLIVTPMTFLGGAFYSVHILPEPWRTITLFNPVVYLISGFRWSFYGLADVQVGVSLGMTVVFLAVFIAIVAWIFKTGYRLKS
jgi:ABC-2 type transport system permease protein